MMRVGFNFVNTEAVDVTLTMEMNSGILAIQACITRCFEHMKAMEEPRRTEYTRYLIRAWLAVISLDVMTVQEIDQLCNEEGL